MPYTTNPKMPKLRAKAVAMVQGGLSMRRVAKYFGFQPSTISRWYKKVPNGGSNEVPTIPSRPKGHPRQLKDEIVDRITYWRQITHGRCSEVIHQHLINEGVAVSLSSVKRTLVRKNLIRKRSPWKRLHRSLARPLAAQPGDLIQLDTIHLVPEEKHKIYVYTLLDVNSRFAYALATNKANSLQTVKFVSAARKVLPFGFKCLQSDHGSEFSQHFSERIKISHRHSRVRRPNDNAHLERFNRTLQQELLSKLPPDVKIINKMLPGYLKYYNEERLHLGLNLKTPLQHIKKCCEGID